MNYFIPVDFVFFSNFLLFFHLSSPHSPSFALASFQALNTFAEALMERERCSPYSDSGLCLKDGYKACTWHVWKDPCTSVSGSWSSIPVSLPKLSQAWRMLHINEHTNRSQHLQLQHRSVFTEAQLWNSPFPADIMQS